MIILMMYQARFLNLVKVKEFEKLNHMVLIFSYIWLRDREIKLDHNTHQVGSQYSYCYSIEEDPRTYNEAMQSRDYAFWKEAIDDEIGSIMENNTWVLSDLPPSCKPLGCKWIFKRKMKVDGTIDKFKARLVIQGFGQKERIDYFDTYAPVARITTIRLLLALAAIHNLVIHQMDVKTSFLNGDLDEEEYMKQPKGFVMPVNEHKKILKKFNREDCSPVSTPMDPVKKLKPNTGKPVDQLEYSRAIGCLMYAMTSTRPDIAYVVGKLSRFTNNPGRQHWKAITRVFKYLKGTMNYDLSYVGYPSVLKVYSDASWINHAEDSSSTSRWVFLRGRGAISWASKKQTWNLSYGVDCCCVLTMAKAYSQVYNEKSRHLGVRHSMIRKLIMKGRNIKGGNGGFAWIEAMRMNFSVRQTKVWETRRTTIWQDDHLLQLLAWKQLFGIFVATPANKSFPIYQMGRDENGIILMVMERKGVYGCSDGKQLQEPGTMNYLSFPDEHKALLKGGDEVLFGIQILPVPKRRYHCSHSGNCLDTRKNTLEGLQFLGDRTCKLDVKETKLQLAMSSQRRQSRGVICKSVLITEYQLADMFMKALPEDRFKYLVRRIESQLIAEIGKTTSWEPCDAMQTFLNIRVGKYDFSYRVHKLVIMSHTQYHVDILHQNFQSVIFCIHNDEIGILPLVSSNSTALDYAFWNEAIDDEIGSFMAIITWGFLSALPLVATFRFKWIFKRKDECRCRLGTCKFKARLVSHERYGELEDVILGIKIKCENNGIVITQSHYIEKILKIVYRDDCSRVEDTHMDSVKKLKPQIPVTINPGRVPFHGLPKKAIHGIELWALTCAGNEAE
ncbi:zinc finger, CCHC-type containing protein [Tanacetum coccineum]